MAESRASTRGSADPPSEGLLARILLKEVCGAAGESCTSTMSPGDASDAVHGPSSDEHCAIKLCVQQNPLFFQVSACIRGIQAGPQRHVTCSYFWVT